MDYLGIGLGVLDKRNPTDEILNDIVKKLKLIGATDDVANAVRKKIESIYNVSHLPGIGLRNKDQDPWLDDWRTKIDWTNWEAYRKYLKTNGFALQTIFSVDKDTDEILNYCGNPQNEESWKIRGLVMGDVQSGKTANYAGLINKATDAGYKFIVVLTGIIEELRSQTQERLDETFVGRNSDSMFNKANSDINIKIGVGVYKEQAIICLTSVQKDFLIDNKKVLQGIPLESITAPIILVMKKNKSALSNLIEFLKTNTGSNSKLNLPFLLLDDEADNASVNAKKDEDPATINRLIRETLSIFNRSSYVAYTATPFANVFINPEDQDVNNPDLFPANFIYSLKQPDNYIGVESLFDEDGVHTDKIQDIEDAEGFFPSNHKKDWNVDGIPKSLENAIDAFLISTAIRDLRYEKLRHRSMLINVSRFTDVQKKLADKIELHLDLRKDYIKEYLKDEFNWKKGGPKLLDLHLVWESLFSGAEFTWDQVRSKIYESIASIKVITVNQRSDEKLLYRQFKGDMGRRVIAVGGLTLSRGLTLEGLAVSYFYRSSKAYDTLLQMGRWFGYREGYDDLFYVWMDPEIQKWYSHISSVVAELRSDLRYMHINGRAPREFGIRIKDHPESLIVTARNKMRNSKSIEYSLSFSNRTIETAYLHSIASINESNVNKTIEFLNKYNEFKLYKNTLILENKSGNEVASLLSIIKIPSNNIEFYNSQDEKYEPLVQFLRSNNIPELKKWIIAIPSGEGKYPLKISGYDIKARNRQFEKNTDSKILEINSRRVGNVTDEQVGLTPDEIADIQKKWKESGSEKKISGFAYRSSPQRRPILTISFIEPSEHDRSSNKGNKKREMMERKDIKPNLLLALSLSFPAYDDSNSPKVVYKLNLIALQNLGLVNEDYEDE